LFAFLKTIRGSASLFLTTGATGSASVSIWESVATEFSAALSKKPKPYFLSVEKGKGFAGSTFFLLG
jgi:hypothetical protein